MTNLLLSRRHISTLTISLALCGLPTSACSNLGKGDGENGSTQAQLGPSQGADVQKPSSLVIVPKANWIDVKASLVGGEQEGRLAAELTDSPGRYGFTNLSAGSYEVILEAKEKDADGKVAPLALKISGISLASGQDAFIREVELKPYVRLEGKILGPSDDENESLEGATVSIVGTSYKAETASDGSYVFENVPQGYHRFLIKRDGYNDGFLFGKNYREEEILPTLRLNQDKTLLEVGVHYLGKAIPANSSQKVSIQLKAPEGMNSFRYALASEAIESKGWIPLQSSLDLDIPQGQKPEIKVQYSLDQRQFSPIFSRIIPVE